MRLSAPGAPHLTYCTNIHPGERWEEVLRTLEGPVPEVKARTAPGAPFGVGLRLSARAAEALGAPGELERLQALLRARGLYVFTLNGFPYGAFHGAPVKEAVYRPDWREPARGTYTDRLAHVLAALLPEGMEGSISTVPGAFHARADTEAAREEVAEGLRAHVGTLHRLCERTGRQVALALEPEPGCLLETAQDAVSFFQAHLLGRGPLSRLARQLGLSPAEAERVLRRHLGLCLDACHMAVEYESPGEALGALAAEGIRVHKVQLSAGLRVAWERGREEETRAALARFADDVYLHQVVERRGEQLRRWLDLPAALAATAGEALDGEWRIHFHVPVFHEALGPFRSTQPFLRELLGQVLRRQVTRHLEVETYTWDVLPAELRAGGVEASVARELRWVLEEVERCGRPSDG